MEALIKLFTDSNQVQIILQNITTYVTYIYPGIISIYWTNFLEAKSTKDTQALIIKSFSISYIYNIILNTVFSFGDNVIKFNGCLLILSILLPYIYFKTKYSNIIRRICEFFGIRTCILSVPFELLKDTDEKYTCFKIYLNDGISAYVGYLDKYEYDENKDRFIILSGYKKYTYINNIEQIIIDNKAEQYNQKVLIKYSEIKIIEKIAENIATDEIYCFK